jgi:hypothetical protein
MCLFHVKPQLAGSKSSTGRHGGLSAILASIQSLLVCTVHGQEQLTRLVARLAFMKEVCFDIVELINCVNATLTHALG